MRILLFAFALLATITRGWWCTGHMIIAEIARHNLDDGVESSLNQVILKLKEDGTFSKCTSFIPCACWSDDLKSDGLTAMAGWHFINMPYDPSSFAVNPPAVIQHDNVAQNINTLEETAKKRGINYWEMEFAIANIIHFIGDVHQPLHATELYSQHFPHGDHGGNEFPVYYQDKQWRLHFIWDSVCGVWQNSPDRPPSQSTLNWLSEMALEFQTNYSYLFNESQKHVFNGTVMAEESFDYAVRYAYAGLQPGDNITQAYIDRCWTAAGQRITLAGYRLASELNYVFGNGGKTRNMTELSQRYHRAHAEYHHHYASLEKRHADAGLQRLL